LIWITLIRFEVPCYATKMYAHMAVDKSAHLTCSCLGRMGTHPTAPSTVAGSDQTLGGWLAAHPQALGAVAERRFGADLPFLFKVRCGPLGQRVAPASQRASYAAASNLQVS
jgi:hypothetical protein